MGVRGGYISGERMSAKALRQECRDVCPPKTHAGGAGAV